MRKMLFALAALAALALLAPNTGVAQGSNNQIGIYTTHNPDFDNLTDADTSVNGNGPHEAYVVLSNPWSDPLDQVIDSVGGFEFRIEWGGLFVTPVIDATATNFQTPPDFYCGSNIPVGGDGAVTLVTLTLASFSADPVPLYITPVSDSNTHTIPGGIAITDADDNFRVTRAYPSSGDFADAVFGFNTSVVPNEDASWGDVKNLYR